MPPGASDKSPDASPFLNSPTDHPEPTAEAIFADESSSEGGETADALRPNPPRDFPSGKAHRVVNAKLRRERKRKAELIRKEKGTSLEGVPN